MKYTVNRLIMVRATGAQIPVGDTIEVNDGDPVFTSTAIENLLRKGSLTAIPEPVKVKPVKVKPAEVKKEVKAKAAPIVEDAKPTKQVKEIKEAK